MALHQRRARQQQNSARLSFAFHFDHKSRGTCPILPGIRILENLRKPREIDSVFGKRTMVEKNGKGIKPLEQCLSTEATACQEAGLLLDVLGGCRDSATRLSCVQWQIHGCQKYKVSRSNQIAQTYPPLWVFLRTGVTHLFGCLFLVSRETLSNKGLFSESFIY